MGIPGQKEGMEGEEEPLVRGGALFPGAPGRKPPRSVLALPSLTLWASIQSQLPFPSEQGDPLVQTFSSVAIWRTLCFGGCSCVRLGPPDNLCLQISCSGTLVIPAGSLLPTSLLPGETPGAEVTGTLDFCSPVAFHTYPVLPC